MIEINQLDLFSGIGGFHIGFERAGYKVNSFFSEIDKHAIAVYKHQFKKSKYVGAVEYVRGADLPRIDVITFGSPCQDFSMAGKREGMGGKRSILILEAIRLIGECRPRVFVWENVKGTFSSNDGEDFAAILQAFANIGGYRLEWQLCNSADYVPQNRERIYLVGYSSTPGGSWRGIFPIQKTGRPRNHVERTTGTSVKIKSALNKGYEVAKEGDSINLTAIKSTTRRGRVGKQKAQTLDTYCEQAVVVPVDKREKQNNVIQVNPSKESGGWQPYQQNRIYSDEGIAPALCSFKSDYKIVAQRGRHQDGEWVQKLEVNQNNISNTLTGVEKDNMVLNISQKCIRRLTPIECERLQGFPDNHTAFGDYDGEIKKMSDSQRYKQCGNAVTTDVVKAVAEQIKPIFLS